MAYTEVEVSNVALATIGENSIVSFDDDNKRARMCKRFYDFTRDYMLAHFDWAFARRFKMLQRVNLPADEVPPGLYAFGLPGDLSLARTLWPYGSRDKWEVFGKYLYAARSENVGLYYTSNEVASAQITIQFANVLALGMAVRLAPPLSQDKKLSGVLYEQFKVEQNEAWQVDANQGNNYRYADEDPNNDTFVNPELAGFLGETNGRP